MALVQFVDNTGLGLRLPLLNDRRTNRLPGEQIVLPKIMSPCPLEDILSVKNYRPRPDCVDELGELC